MAIEQLTDTALFSRVRIPLSDFLAFPGCIEKKKNAGQVVHTEHPATHFRCQPGFYRHSEFTAKIFPHLGPRPTTSPEQYLFVWTLKKDCAWIAARNNFEGKNQPVPWWVIRPFLKYAASGEQQAVVESRHPVPFFMQALGWDGKSFSETVSLELRFFTIHTEWWLSLFAPDAKDVCYQGQTFLAVA